MRLGRSPGAGFVSLISVSLALCAGLAGGADETSRSMPAYEFEGPVRVGAQAALSFEAEGLLAIGHVVTRGGTAVAQPMAAFGEGWSGGEQLFWADAAPGDELTLIVPLLADGNFAVDIYPTRAPDYATLEFRIGRDGEPVTFDGYAPCVESAGAVRIGPRALQGREALVHVRVLARSPVSTGLRVGIDRLVLVPVSPSPPGGGKRNE